MNHLMIDFETLDTKPTSVVLSLGAVLFNKQHILSTFYCEFDIASQMRVGRTMSADTIMWWLNQQTGRGFSPNTSEDFVVTINKFLLWYATEAAKIIGIDQVWANDPDFDCAILEDILIKHHGGVPYSFYQKRSMRTFVQYVGKGVKIPRTLDQQHNALVDAIDQAKYVMERLP